MSSRSRKITHKSFKREVYSDFAPNLDLDPTTGLITRIVNEDAIRQSVRNLVLTYPTERFYHPEIGSPISRLLFELDGIPPEIVADEIKDKINYTLNSFEPRVTNVSARVDDHAENNYLSVTVSFAIINNPNKAFSVKIPIRVR